MHDAAAAADDDDDVVSAFTITRFSLNFYFVRVMGAWMVVFGILLALSKREEKID